MAYEKLRVYKVIKGPKGEQGEQGDQGAQGEGYTGPASPYQARLVGTGQGLALRQVKCGKTAGVVWMVSESALSIGTMSYVTVNIACSGASILNVDYVTKCDNVRFYKLSKNPGLEKTLLRQGGEEIRLTADGYLAYSNSDVGNGGYDGSDPPSGFVRAPLGCSLQFSYFVHE